MVVEYWVEDDDDTNNNNNSANGYGGAEKRGATLHSVSHQARNNYTRSKLIT